MDIQKIADPRTYIKNIKENSSFSVDNIVVEHRSNNPKRDFLFVNRKQCKHIPARASEMISMCKELAEIVNESIAEYKNVIIVAFAETATAIGNFVAEYLPNCKIVMQTTREDIPNSRLLFTFNEEHSHAVTQKLIVDDKFSMSELGDVDYVLFVEDEISTGNTILNFVKAFEENIGKGKKFGVASICNWQSKENIQNFNKLGIDRFFLISGELQDVNAKMFTPEEYKEIQKNNTNTADTEHKNNANDTRLTNVFIDGVKLDIDDVKRNYAEIEKGIISKERFPHLKNYLDLTGVYGVLDKYIYSSARSIRVVGTEEYMYIPIKIAEYLEKFGIHTVCHATTRSSIDVSTKCGIIDKHEIISVYDNERKTYIYNTDEYVDFVIIVSDRIITVSELEQYRKVFNTGGIGTLAIGN